MASCLNDMKKNRAEKTVCSVRASLSWLRTLVALLLREGSLCDLIIRAGNVANPNIMSN